MVQARKFSCRIPIRRTLFACVLVCLTTASWAEDDDAKAGFEFFENKIRPILVDHCYDCHSAKSDPLRAGLSVDTRKSIREGGDSGEAVVPDDIESSLLITALKYDEDDLQMPPDGKLSDEVIADFEAWIEMGAPDPRDEPKPTMKADAADHSKTNSDTEVQAEAKRANKLWAFKPVSDPTPPKLSKAQYKSWPTSQLDRFIATIAERDGKPIAGDADRRTLLRRTTFALTGLAPTRQQTNDLLADDSETAFAELVDRLLDSSQYGERWGRHWLDVARFSESSGGGRSQLLRDAWRYRDYVIAAFNKDKPFDDFIREQIAGDLLPFESNQQQAEYLTATGFLVLGPTNYELQDKDLLRMEVVDEQIDTIGRAFLGMTVGCARCHDHKFDPIPTRDYYALAGIFRNTKTLTPGNVAGFVTRPLPVDSKQAAKLKAQNALKARLEKRSADLRKQIAAADPVIKLPGTVIDNDSDQVKVNGNWKPSTFIAGYVGSNYIHDEGQPKTQSVVYSAKVATGEYLVFASYTSGANRSPAAPFTVVHAEGSSVTTVDQRRPPATLGRWQKLGSFNFSNKNPAIIQLNTQDTTGIVIADAVWIVTPADFEKLQRESAVASKSRNAKTKAELTKQLKQTEARLVKLKNIGPVVMSVEEEKEIDDGHIHIRGGIRNLGDKVPRGFLSAVSWEKPTKIPATTSGRLQLANWIANPKHPLTARVIVNRVCQHLGLTVVGTPDNFGSMGEQPVSQELLDWLTRRFIEDGWSIKKLVRRIVSSHYFRLAGENAANDNQFTYPRRRLDAECIRDAILQVTGELDLTPGGPGMKPKTNSEYGYQFDSHRRSVYLPVFRNATPALLAAFDFPNANLVNGKRSVSTLPTQALYLMNSPFIIERSRKAAERLLAETNEAEGQPQSASQLIDRAFEKTLGRLPTSDERSLANSFVTDSADIESMSGLFQSLFSSLDFRYVD